MERQDLELRAHRMLKHYAARTAQWHAMIFCVKSAEASLDNSAQKYGGSMHSAGGHSDPVAHRYAQLEKLRKAEVHAFNQIRAVLEVMTALKCSDRESEREMFLILERHYGEHESIEDIAGSLGKSERTLYRRRRELETRVRVILRKNHAEKWQKTGGKML